MAQTQEPDIDALLLAEQERLNKRKEELESELTQLNVRLSKINRYFTDEEPQDPFKLTPPRPSSDRRERGAVQEQVKATIYSRPQGISTSELNKALDGISPQSIQNSLTRTSQGRPDHQRRRQGRQVPTSHPRTNTSAGGGCPSVEGLFPIP
jgi:hypothetical protein